MRTRTVGALGATALMLASSGCGSGGGSYANASRPPAPLTISIVVASNRVGVSPSRIGAGPAVLLIANESTRSRNVTLGGARGGGSSCVAEGASSGPINPQSTARIQLPLGQGACAVGVADGTLAPARLTVGPERPSAQQDLLQP
jgi:hypothetical protein